MAVRVLMLRKKRDDLQKKLDEARAAGEQLQTREAELEQAIEEAATDEERQVVEESVEDFEKDRESNDKEQKRLESEISDIEAEIEQYETAPPAAPQGEERTDAPLKQTRTNEAITMDMTPGINSRTRIYNTLKRNNLTEREDVREWLERVRQLSRQERAVTGADLLIPTVTLDILRENIQGYSKLLKHVRMRSIRGKARQTIGGTVPEAVWTEMCAKLNELDIRFNAVEVDGYKVGGFIAVCKALLEDSDINLATEILDMLGQSIGFALDKAIIYGTDVKMPQGIATRLAQTTEPADYPASAPDWKDLHTSNLQKIAATLKGVDFFSALILAAGNAKSKYSMGTKFWAMNETTYSTLMSKALAFNASGAIVAQMNQQMPIVGGQIELLEFIPDNDIWGGYGDLYLLVERHGIYLAQSEHVQFIEDNIVFKGTARYDGMPVIADGFVGININNQAVTTSATFAPDEANTETPPEP